MIASDAKSLMPRAHAHMHEVHNDEGFTQESPHEEKMIIDKIDPLVIGDKNLNASASNINYSET